MNIQGLVMLQKKVLISFNPSKPVRAEDFFSGNLKIRIFSGIGSPHRHPPHVVPSCGGVPCAKGLTFTYKERGGYGYTVTVKLGAVY